MEHSNAASNDVPNSVLNLGGAIPWFGSQTSAKQTEKHLTVSSEYFPSIDNVSHSLMNSDIDKVGLPIVTGGTVGCSEVASGKEAPNLVVLVDISTERC